MQIIKYLFISLILFFSMWHTAWGSVEIESDISLDKLTARLNDQIARQRMPVVTSQNKDLYTVFSYPTKQIIFYDVSCAEIYWDANDLGVMLLLGFHVQENPFVQVIRQSNGYFTLIRLRRLCVE